MEFVEDTIRVVQVEESVLAELDALGDGSADKIYMGEEIISRCCRATGLPIADGCRVSNVMFENPKRDGAWKGQIGSDPGGGAALES